MKLFCCFVCVGTQVVGTEEGADEVYDIDDEGQMIKLKRVLKRDATELAVTTSISHPNIVQVSSVEGRPRTSKSSK